jgi:MoaA/NifB/PqqE/SkfB family radical SAM enzyme
MVWYTRILNERLSPLLELEAKRPYLLALLLQPRSALYLVPSRVANYCAARRAESEPRETVEHAPYHLVLDPSNVCNLRCPLCVHVTAPEARRRTMLSARRAREIIHGAQSTVIRLDLFNWGEPLLNPSFAEIVGLASEAGLHTRTSSHFSFDVQPDWDRVIASGLRYIVASIDGTDQMTYGRYRVRGSLDSALDNLRALIVAKRRRDAVFPLVEWQFLAMRHNVGQIETAVALAREIGADVIRYGGARGRMDIKTLLPTPEVVNQSGSYLLDSSHPLSEYDAVGQKVRREEGKGCRWLWGKAAVHADGRMTPCWNGWAQSHDVAEISASGDIAAAWRSDAFKALRRSVLAGGDGAGRRMCDRCAHSRSFVPTPDFDRETLPTRDDVDHAVRVIEGAGWTVPPTMADAVRRGFEQILRPLDAEHASV